MLAGYLRDTQYVTDCIRSWLWLLESSAAKFVHSLLPCSVQPSPHLVGRHPWHGFGLITSYLPPYPCFPLSFVFLIYF